MIHKRLALSGMLSKVRVPPEVKSKLQELNIKEVGVPKHMTRLLRPLLTAL